MNADGRIDLVSASSHGLVVYTQQTDGTFPPGPKLARAAIPYLHQHLQKTAELGEVYSTLLAIAFTYFAEDFNDYVRQLYQQNDPKLRELIHGLRSAVPNRMEQSLKFVGLGG